MPKTLSERDAAAVWHPATHFRDLERLPPLPIRSARGAWLESTDGHQILDGISSWWTCLHGHGHPAIVEAIRDQVGRLDHVMFAGFTHEPAVALAETLLERAPAGYGKVFYADCGSAAIEVAMKMSFQSRKQRGEGTRTRFAALQRSYHGETLGALAVCGNDIWRQPFGELLTEALYLPSPIHPAHDTENLAGNPLGADSMEADEAVHLIEAHAPELTALLIEPVVQCASRMTMPGVGFYRRVVETAQRCGVHVIADEIAVAFGRTGKLFASEWAGVTPDLLCLSKGLSGGVLPLSCVLVRDGFEDDFRGPPGRSFLHSHTFTGNPVTCRAGLASLKLFETEGTLKRLPSLTNTMATLRRQVAERCPAVAHHRQAGMIAALELDPDAAKRQPDGRLSLALREAALARGVLLRPLHDTIYWMPPLCVTEPELETLAAVTAEAIMAVT